MSKENTKYDDEYDDDFDEDDVGVGGDNDGGDNDDVSVEEDEDLYSNFDDDLENEEFLDNSNGDVDCEVLRDDTDFEIIFKTTANKHKQEGIHSLNRDTILMGKKENDDVDDESYDFESSTEFNDIKYDIEKGSSYEFETHYNEDYNYKKNLTNDIYELLNDKTEIDFLVNRRKPNKQTFNDYYEMCIKNLSLKYTKSEIFVELSYYFTDNIFNMFKLLNKKNASGIIIELTENGYLNDIGNINFI